MSKIIKWIIIVLVFGFLIYVGTFIYALANLGDEFDYHTYEELVGNYNLKTKEISSLKDYIHNIVPPDKYVDIEFADDKMLDIFHVEVNGKYEKNRHIEIESDKADSLLRQLGWTRETLRLLKQKLDNANCISIASGRLDRPCNIGFQRSGMGKYYYRLHYTPIIDSLKSEYTDSCNFILYNDTVVFHYAGGAIGPQCFPDFRRKVD